MPAAVSVVDGQLIVGTGPAGAVNVSAIEIDVNVTLPVLVTTNEYDTVSPMPVIVAGDADLTTVNDGDCVVVTVAVDGVEVTAGPVCGVPLAVAEFLIVPVLKSAAVDV